MTGGDAMQGIVDGDAIQGLTRTLAFCVQPIKLAQDQSQRRVP